MSLQSCVGFCWKTSWISHNYIYTCQGPAPVESGVLKGRRLWRSGYGRIKDIKSDQIRIAQWENSVEKRGWITWFTWITNKTSRQEVCTIYVRPLAPVWIVQVSILGEPPCSRWEFSLKRRGREREKERETRGEPDFQETSSRSWSEKLVHPLLSGKAFYTFGCT